MALTRVRRSYSLKAKLSEQAKHMQNGSLFASVTGCVSKFYRTPAASVSVPHRGRIVRTGMCRQRAYEEEKPLYRILVQYAPCGYRCRDGRGVV
jgi:hypothetical protein